MAIRDYISDKKKCMKLTWNTRIWTVACFASVSEMKEEEKNSGSLYKRFFFIPVLLPSPHPPIC